MVRRQDRALRTDHPGPGCPGVPLRAGDFRGAEGLYPGGRVGRGVPAARQRGPVQPVCAQARDACDAGVGLRPRHRAARSPRPGLGADGREQLYLRPFMIATKVGLGVNHPSSDYLFTLIASPVSGYFGGEVKPVTVWLSEDYTRAAPGGTGEAKCGGNYAAAFAGQQQANDHGCDQVVWLDAVERQWVEEMGGMNICFVYGRGSDARIMTPALTGSLLPGITRDSLLKLAPDLGIPAYEGRISVADWRAGCASGEITEVFACGTAAVITPIGAVRSNSGDWTIGDGTAGRITSLLREELVGIQYGRKPDRYGWVHRLA